MDSIYGSLGVPTPHDEIEPMNDQSTTIADLRRKMSRFVDERLWRKFHKPKNLAMSLAVEAAELMEHFQWLTHGQAEELLKRPAARRQVASEMADVLSFLLSLSAATGIDLCAAFESKLAANERKYPARLCRGKYQKPRPRRPGRGGLRPPASL
jgi:NTP pyrophosphatase (non-canonical NTP hydrolase)